MKNLQLLAFDNNQSEFSYNFLIGDDGNVYEGRGYQFEGEITNDQTFNYLGLIIVFIGKFDTSPPSTRQVSTLETFLDALDDRQILTTDYNILLEYQLINADVPFSEILSVLSKMEKFHECRNFGFFHCDVLQFFTILVSRINTRSFWGASSPKDESKVTYFDQPVDKFAVTKLVDSTILCSTLVRQIIIFSQIFD